MPSDCNCAAHQLAASRNFLTADDVDLLHETAKTLMAVGRPIVVVELGAGAGTSALAVFHTLAPANEAQVVSIDNDVANLDWARKAVQNAGYADRWVPVYGLSWERFGPQPDFLLIDAGHDGESVWKDWQAWGYPLFSGTPVWFHDYASAYPEVTEVVDKLVADGFLKIVEQRGWGILTERTVR